MKRISSRRLWSSFGIGARLALGIGTLLALLVLVAALGGYGLRESARAHAAANDDVSLAMAVAQLASGLQSMRRHEKDVFLGLGNAEHVQRSADSWQAARDAAQGVLERARTLAEIPDHTAQLRKLKPSLAAYEAGFAEVLNAHRRGALATGAQAREQMALLQSSADLVEEQSLELGSTVARRVDESRRALDASTQSTRTMLVALSALAVALGAAVGWLITRSVTGPIAVAAQRVQDAAQGDLTTRPTMRASGEVGRLVADIAAMSQALGEIVDEVRRRAQAVDTGAAQIQRGNHELSRRTEAQATALEETAAAVAAFSAAIRENALAAASADAVAREASEMARQAGSVTVALLERFRAIEESSRRIAEVISLVESIAFQTNILALNAAIEAARAGEAGRGFSVVAAEVRRLSQGTTEAAHQIAALVEAAGRNVAEGGRIVADTGRAIEGVGGRIEVLSRSVSDIASATHEQRVGVEQIGQALTQLDAVTQENAHLAEQSSAAAGTLEEIAANLVAAVSRFRIDEARVPPAAPSPQLGLGQPRGLERITMATLALEAIGERRSQG